jgi:hypothetical protein
LKIKYKQEEMMFFGVAGWRNRALWNRDSHFHREIENWEIGHVE